jgi:hypothetical protein
MFIDLLMTEKGEIEEKMVGRSEVRDTAFKEGKKHF